MQFDGGSRGNPGPAAGAAIVTFDDGNSEARGVYLGDDVTNNAAEYHALIVGLRLAQSMGVNEISITGDSKLVVNHVNGDWECKHPDLRPLMKEARGILNGFFVDWELVYVPRAQNKCADAMCNRTLDAVQRARRSGIKGFRRKS